jgi:hypothetical protein
MASVRETWAAMSGRSRVGSVLGGVGAVALVIAIAGGGALASGAFAQPTVDPEAEVEPTAVAPGTSLHRRAPTR